jgi:radical SAM protein with 4Fe4S-binding SPASM domain
MLTGACATCEMGPVCAAGCRSYNYFANRGKLYENKLCARASSAREPEKSE